jgi:hypothetical protein
LTGGSAQLDATLRTSLRRGTVLHLGQLDFVAGRENALLLVPWPPAHAELYPGVVDGLEEEGGVPSPLLKTDRRKAEKEGTPWQMLAGSRSRSETTRSRSRSTSSRARALGA